MNNHSFYMVWCDATMQAQYRHPDYSCARREAERLARANPGKRFHVLKSEGSCLCESPVVWDEPAKF